MKTLADLAAPAKTHRKLLEKDIQKQCVDWARARGYWARKFSSMTQNSVPDYLFARVMTGVFHGRKVQFACEFKRPGNSPTKAQQDEMHAMEEAGWDVFWADNFEDFKNAVLTLEGNAQ